MAILRPMHAFFVLATLMGLGCSSGDDTDLPGETGDSVVAKPASTEPGTCEDRQEGCPCEREGARYECGIVVEHRSDGRVVCGRGGVVCSGGVWSACTIDAYAPGH
jgi:hypothetical protein